MKSVLKTAALIPALFAAVSFSTYSSANAESRISVFLVAQHSNKCAQVHGGGMENGAAITQWDCVNQPNVIWDVILKSTAAGTYILKAHNSNKCAQVNDESLSNGAVISQWDCVKQANVRWMLVDAGGGAFYIKNQESEKCMQVNGGSFDNGAAITQWDCVDQPNVKWVMQSAN